MTVARLIGMLFLLAAVIALTADLSRPGASGALAFASLYKHWSDFAPQTLAAAQRAVSGSAHPLLWDLILKPILLVPAWITFAFFGGLAIYIGRRRRRVQIFVN